MNKVLFISLMLLLTFQVSACGTETPDTDNTEQDENGNSNLIPGENGRYLVLFTSRTGNTESMAKIISGSLKCDLLEVVPTVPYDGDYNSMLQRARNEQSAIGQGNYPSIKTSVKNFDDYDVIFIGYPIWHGHMATTMQAFLHAHRSKLSGKQIALFASSGSSGIGTSVTEARTLCPDATFTETLLLTSSSLGQKESRIGAWLQKLNITVDAD